MCLQKKTILYPVAVLALLLGSGLVTGGCSSSDDKPPLEGERIPVIRFNDSEAVDPETQDVPWILAPEAANVAWPQQGGAATHVPGHVALGREAPKQVWRTSIGSGSRKDSKLITVPVIADNKVFAADTRGMVSCFDLETGKRLWQVSAMTGKKDRAMVSPGLTYGARTLFVTDGIGHVLALDPQDGKRLWTRPLEQPVRGSPTYLDGHLYVITLNDETLALDAQTGQTMWKHEGVREMAGLLGAPSPAAEGSVVITAYSSGDIIALRAETGQEAWSDNLSGAAEFLSRAVTQLSGFRGHPVLDQDLVFAGNSSSRMVAIHVPSGERLWQKEFGISGTPWVSGNNIFVVTSQNMLMALLRETGQVRWSLELPRFKDRAREEPVFWHGPVLAGERLVLAGSNRTLLEVDPLTGKILRETGLPDAVMLPPVVARQTLIILTDDGDMVAYRS